jgi:hypothetical protein
VLARRQSPNALLHLILTVLTAGLWLIVWFFRATSNRSLTYLCTNCGTPVSGAIVDREHRRLQEEQEESEKRRNETPWRTRRRHLLIGFGAGWVVFLILSEIVKASMATALVLGGIVAGLYVASVFLDGLGGTRGSAVAKEQCPACGHENIGHRRRCRSCGSDIAPVG